MCIRDRSIKFEIQNHNFNELKNDIQEMNECCKNTHETIMASLNKLEQSVERMGVHAMKTEKNKTNENCNDKCENMIPEKELINDNNNVENHENNSNVFEELVSETDTVKIKNESTDELVECNDNEMLMCIDEVERVWKNNVVEEWGQRANFPLIAVSYTHLDVYKRQAHHHPCWFQSSEVGSSWLFAVVGFWLAFVDRSYQSYCDQK